MVVTFNNIITFKKKKKRDELMVIVQLSIPLKNI